MNKPIFENDQEARDFLDDMGWLLCSESITKLKQKGYIKKSSVEEAEEMYETYLQMTDGYLNNDFYHRLIKKQRETIQEIKERFGDLVKALERLAKDPVIDLGMIARLLKKHGGTE